MISPKEKLLLDGFFQVEQQMRNQIWQPAYYSRIVVSAKDQPLYQGQPPKDECGLRRAEYVYRVAMNQETTVLLISEERTAPYS